MIREKIFRIRKYSGYEGGSNYYHHADVIEKKWYLALRAAKEGRVYNWRWVDTYDTSKKTYEYYEYLGIINEEWARNPQKPKAAKRKLLTNNKPH